MSLPGTETNLFFPVPSQVVSNHNQVQPHLSSSLEIAQYIDLFLESSA